MTARTSGSFATDLSPLKRAFLALEQLQAKCAALELARSEPIAVVGMACRLPGGADSPDAYWRLLQSSTDAICDVPPGRWDADAFYDPDPAVPGKMCTRLGGYLRERIDLFDPQFFGISPREAESIDPQHRLLLETGWEALEHAAHIEDRVAGSATGVFIGITSHDYSDLHVPGHDLSQVGTHLITGNSHNAAAGRLSYCFGFHGPALAVDTACSSSLVAIHLACKSLLQDECRSALAGGVNLILSPLATIALSQGRVLAPDGRCRAFDADASGMVRGEGCAMLVLKRLSHAVEDGDNILAVIRGTAVNQDGPSSGLTVPNGPAQEALIAQALASAGLRPNDIDYIEAHGTGTPLGDPIELRALAGVFGAGRNTPLILGSVKTNLGHLEACAGIAGVIKVVLSLQHGEIPAHLNFQHPTPHLAWDELPFLVPAEARPWASGSRLRRAGVSSFGFSGVNAHVILQEAPEASARSAAVAAGSPGPEAGRPIHLLPLSGRSDAALRETVQRWEGHLARHPALPLEDVCFSAGVGRAHAPHRLAVTARTTEEMREALAAYLDGRPAENAVHRHATTAPKVAFLFTGQGSQYHGMARELFDTQPQFRRTMTRCDEILRPLMGCSLLQTLYEGDAETSRLNDTLYAQPALFAVGYALAELWQSWGVRPAAVLGHSLGEYVAACIAGVFGLEDGLLLIAARAKLMQGLPRDGAMLAVSAPAADVERIIRRYGSQVTIAAYNTPDSVVISGEQNAVAQAARQFDEAGVRTHPLAVSHAFHSHLMDPILAAFENEVRKVSLSAPRVELISNLTGAPASAEVTTSAYWRRHLRERVRFAQGVAAAREKGCSVFLEIGPKPTLLGLARECLDDQDLRWLPSLRPGVPDTQPMLQSLAALYVEGARIDWSGFDREFQRRRVALPTTPFQRQRYWWQAQSPPDRAPHAIPKDDLGHPLLGRRLSLAGTADICFESQIRADDPVFLQDHLVLGQAVFPASAYLEMAAAAASEAFCCQGAVLENISFQQALRLSEQDVTVQTILKSAGADAYSFDIYSRNKSSSESWTCHAAGQCRPLPENTVTPEATVPFAKTGETVEPGVIYRRAGACGVDLGPRFQALRRAWRGETSASGEIALPDTLASEADDYQMHPVLLDAAFQTMGAMFADRTERDLYLPVALDRVEFHHCGGAAGFSQVEIETSGSGAEQALRADVRVLTADGRLAAKLDGLQMTRTSRDKLQTAASSEFADWLYEVQWIAANLEPAQPPADLSRDAPAHWLITAPAGSTLADDLRTRIERAGERATLVHPGETYRFAGDGTAWIDPSEPAHFSALLDDVGKSHPGRLARIVHLWGTSSDPASDFANNAKRAGMLGWGTALHLIQAVLKAENASPPEMWLVTRRAQGIEGHGDVTGIAHAPLLGLGKAVNVERPELHCVCVDLDTADDQAAGSLFDEIRARTPEDQVAFRGGQRYVARLARHVAGGGNLSSLLRPDVTYVVTGGLQGLGLETAKWLVERGARSLVLLSRRGPGPESSDSIEAMRRQGAVVRAVACDVSDFSQLTDVFGDIDVNHPPLSGIIHAAGVIEDSTLAQDNVDRFQRVLDPKMLGAWHLHLLTRHRPLDFFVMYSSMASLLGSAGQANYTGANACLDALAHHRKASGLPALSINWGGWSEIGLAARKRLEQRIASHGLGMISPQQGPRILEHLLSSPSVVVGAAPIDWSLLAQQSRGGRSRLLSNFRERRAGLVHQNRGVPDCDALRSAPPAERHQAVADLLRTEIATVLRLSPEDVAMQQPLNRIGLDSLMAVELRNRLRSQLRLDVPLVTFMQDTSIAGLVSDLSERLGSSNVPPSNSGPAGADAQTHQANGSRALYPPDPKPLLDQLDRLTDAEVDALLAAELSGKLTEAVSR